MINKQIILNVIFLFGLGLTGLQAQESLNASGGDASGIGGKVNYSVGQVFYSINNGTNANEVQGVQQPFEISEVTSIESTNEIELTISVYPNPTSNSLTLSYEGNDFSDLSYQLFDVNGKTIQDQKLSNYETIVSMNHLVPETYILRIMRQNKEVKTYKIIKK